MLTNKSGNIRAILNILNTVLIFSGFYVIWLYKGNNISKNNTMFWVSVIVFIASFVELIASLITKESNSKGVIIAEEQTPNLYNISLLSTLAVCILCLFGMYYYY